MNYFSSIKTFLRVFRWRGLLFWCAASASFAWLSGSLLRWRAGTEITKWSVESAACATLCGLLSFYIFLHLAKTSWVQENLLPFYDALTSGLFQVAAVVSLLVVVCVGVVERGFSFETFGHYIFENPGGLFTIVTGALTFAGVAITLQSIFEFRQTITSFEQLVRRINFLIDGTASDDYVRCLVFTPAIGSLSLPKRDWKALYNRLLDAPGKIQMICLDESDLKKYHDLFIGRKTDRDIISRPAVDDAQKKALMLIQELKDSGNPPVCKPEAKLPGYYMFANRHRAIVAAPFFMPMPAHEFTDDQIQRLPSVQMFGFETSDSLAVHAVHSMLDLYGEKRTCDDADAATTPLGARATT